MSLNIKTGLSQIITIPDVKIKTGESIWTDISDGYIKTNDNIWTKIYEKTDYDLKILIETSVIEEKITGFKLYCAGEFVVNWGDGETETILKPDVNSAPEYYHTYKNIGQYYIKLKGTITEYPINSFYSAINFSWSPNLISISGNLTTLMPDNINGITPSFTSMFQHCENLSTFPLLSSQNTYIIKPAMFFNMFQNCAKMNGTITIGNGNFGYFIGSYEDGMCQQMFLNCELLESSLAEFKIMTNLSGNPTISMCNSTFSNCNRLYGEIPLNIFGSLSGSYANNMFQSTFSNCTNLGIGYQIPEGLFGNLSGGAVEYCFDSTFKNTSFAGKIPTELFGNITSVNNAIGMFRETFLGCSNLIGIEEGIWTLPQVDQSNKTSLSNYFFQSTFSGCSNLAGDSPSIQKGGIKLYENWISPIANQVSECFYGCTSLSDYGNIPLIWL